jgi:hypothetical protein
MIKTNQPQIGLKELFKQAKQNLKQGNLDDARDLIDFGILRIAQFKELDDLKDDDLIEGVKVDLWLTRFWVFLETNELILE